MLDMLKNCGTFVGAGRLLIYACRSKIQCLLPGQIGSNKNKALIKSFYKLI